jgi:leukotriene-A4 hydrolase
MNSVLYLARAAVASAGRIPFRLGQRMLVRTMASTTINMPRDPNTLSNYNSWKTKHTIAELAIDFKKQRLTGTVTLQLESITEKESEEIILDTSFLDVSHQHRFLDN